MPGRIGSPTPPISGERGSSPPASVPSLCPAPGGTTRSAGLTPPTTPEASWTAAKSGAPHPRGGRATPAGGAGRAAQVDGGPGGPLKKPAPPPGKKPGGAAGPVDEVPDAPAEDEGQREGHDGVGRPPGRADDVDDHGH